MFEYCQIPILIYVSPPPLKNLLLNQESVLQSKAPLKSKVHEEISQFINYYFKTRNKIHVRFEL